MTAASSMSKEAEASSFRAALPALAFLAGLFFLNFTSRVVFSPLMPVVSSELGLSHAGAGSFFLAISSGYFVSILLSGHVSSRISHKRTIILSSVASGVMMLLLSTCTSLVTLRLGLVGLGFAAGLYLSSGLITITRLVPAGYTARGLAVHELAPNLSFVLTPVVCVAGLTLVSWRTELAILGGLLICTGALYQRYGSGQGLGIPPRLAVMKQLLSLSRFWLITAMFSMAICSTLGIYAMLPLYLVSEQGMDVKSANSLVALSRIGSVAMPLLAGWFGDRFGNQAVMGGVLFLAGLFTIPLGCTDGWLLTAMVVLQPMVAVCFFPSAFAVLSAVGPKEAKNVAISFCIPLAFLGGGGILPTVIGAIGDHYSLGAGMIAAGCLMVLASLLSMGLRGKTSQ